MSDMDSVVRVVIMTLTVIALIYILSHQPRPVAVTPVIPYCEIDYPAAIKDRRGKWHRYWGHSWAPCTLMDRYEDV